MFSATDRDYMARMLDEKVECMKVARKFDRDYWDGARRFGFGGYKYIPGYWEPIVDSLVDRYSLTSKSRILDVGCGKGFVLQEFASRLPGCHIEGFDVSTYALAEAHCDIQSHLYKHDAAAPFPLESKCFDLAISIMTLHNLDLPGVVSALREMQRVSRHSYVVVESFRDELSMFNVQCWALTAKTIIGEKDWVFIFEVAEYEGDFELIYFY